MSAALSKYERMASWRCYALGETRRTLVEIITDRTNEASGSGCTLSLASFSKMTGVSDRMIRKHLRWLEDVGVIAMQRSRGKSTHEILVRTPDENTKIKSRFEGEDAADDTANPEPLEFRVGKASTRNDTSANPEVCDPSTRNPKGSANTLDTFETLGGAPSQGAPPKGNFLRSKVVEVPSSDTEPEETEAGLGPATVPVGERPDNVSCADEVQRIDAREERSRPTSEPVFLASAPSIEDADDDDATPVLDLHRLETDDFPASIEALEAFAAIKGLAVTRADRTILLEILEDEREHVDDEDEEAAWSDRPVDEDDLRRLRAGVTVDRNRCRIPIPPRDGSALRMLSDATRRADFVGRVNDAAERLARGERRRGYWADRLSELKTGLVREGVHLAHRDRLLRELSREVGAEMARREDAVTLMLKEAVL